MIKPKIIILIDWYLPGTKAGGPVRSVYSMVNVLKSFFDFYIITANRDLGCTQPYPNIESNTLFLKEEVNYYYFSTNKLNSINMLKLIKQINPNLIYLNSFWSYQFSISIIKLKNKNKFDASVVLAPRGMLGLGALSLKPLKKKLYLAVAKLFGWYNSISFHATQKQEEQDIVSKFPKAKITTIQNINSNSPIKNTSIKKIIT